MADREQPRSSADAHTAASESDSVAGVISSLQRRCFHCIVVRVIQAGCAADTSACVAVTR